MLPPMKPKVGEMAPDFRATVVDGEEESELSLEDLRGETVVLVFYPKDNTPGCTIQACSMRDHWDEVKGKARVYGVSEDGEVSHKKFMGIERSTFVIGPDGRIAAVLEKASPLSHTEKLSEILG